MVAAAERTESKSSSDIGTNSALVDGLICLIWEMTELTRAWERARRMTCAGLPWARAMAVSAPKPFSLAPVMTTASGTCE